MPEPEGFESNRLITTGYNYSAWKTALLMDIATEIAHPENEPIATYFKANSAYDTETDTYRLHARPDLTGELHDVIAETDIPATRIGQVPSTAGPWSRIKMAWSLRGRAAPTTSFSALREIRPMLLVRMEPE